MKVYAISEDYSGLFEELFFEKENAEKYLENYVKESHLELDDFRVIELEVR